MEYPETPQRPVTDILHGHKVVDPYRWLESDKDPEVVAWAEAQNRLARDFLDNIPLRSALERRLTELKRRDVQSPPYKVPHGSRVFFWARKAEQERRVYFVRERPEASAEVLLDLHELDEDEDVYPGYLSSLRGLYPSPDGRYVAYGVAKGGSEYPEVRIMNVETRELLPDTLQGRGLMDLNWLPDGSGFYYTAGPPKSSVPENELDYWVTTWHHRLGTQAEQDRKVYDEKDRLVWGYVFPSDDGRHELLLRAASSTASELHVRPLGSSEEPKPIVTGFDGEHMGTIVNGRVVFRTADSAPGGRVVSVDADDPRKENWRELVPQHEKDSLTGIYVADRLLYAVYDRDVHAVVKVFDSEGGFIREVTLPGLGSAEVYASRSEQDVWIVYESFLSPPTLYRYDFEADALRPEGGSAADIGAGFVTRQVWFRSKDGTSVPMFLVHREGLEPDGSTATYLAASGGFGVAFRPYFVRTAFAWVEAGGIFAVPGIRGGGELGEEWYKAGILKNKQNTFDDLFAAAEWLIGQGYTCSSKLGLYGRSSAGLVAGAVLTQRPELFRAVMCDRPLLDMLRFDRYGYGGDWVAEYGSPEDPEFFDILRRYSPCHNVSSGQDYPSVLLRTAENDIACHPMHGYKMAARLQKANPTGNPVLLLVQPSSGHEMDHPTVSAATAEKLDQGCFLMQELGLKPPPGW